MLIYAVVDVSDHVYKSAEFASIERKVIHERHMVDFARSGQWSLVSILYTSGDVSSAAEAIWTLLSCPVLSQHDPEHV